MHSSAQFADSPFSVAIAGRDGLWVDDLFPGFDERDRLGVVVRHPLGALGTSTGILASVTAFYDVQRARGGEFFISRSRAPARGPASKATPVSSAPDPPR